MALEDAKNPMRGVSGPGPYAKRTDLSYQSQSYGDGVAYNAAKSGAPLSTAPKNPLLSQAPQVTQTAKPSPVTGLYDQTQRPDEPVTHGIDLGPGGGSNVLGMPDQAQTQYTNAYDMFTQMALNPDASPSIKYLAQRIQQGF
jgi:hypothetical protein